MVLGSFGDTFYTIRISMWKCCMKVIWGKTQPNFHKMRLIKTHEWVNGIVYRVDSKNRFYLAIQGEGVRIRVNCLQTQNRTARIRDSRWWLFLFLFPWRLRNLKAFAFCMRNIIDCTINSACNQFVCIRTIKEYALTYLRKLRTCILIVEENNMFSTKLPSF